jgi:hypothetical protein
VSQPPVVTDGGTDAGDAGAAAALRARIASPSSPAAIANGISSDTLIESIDIVAPDATAPSGSSIGLIAQNSSKLELSHVKVHAGTAMAGSNGAQGVQIPDSPGTRDGAMGFAPYWCHTAPGSVQCAIDPRCIDTQCVTEHSTRPGGTNACPGGTPAGAGGNGGSGGNFIKETTSSCNFTYADVNLRHVGDGDARPATAATALGGIAAPLCAQTPENGAPGVSGADGVDGTTALSGVVDATGFKPGDGTPGTNGAPGQGGGGGGGAMPKNKANTYYKNGDDYWGASGSGGGAGGCAGLAGTAGKGGGASIGIVLSDSPIVLRNCIVEASNGGAGGAGSLGSDPTPAGGPGGHLNTPPENTGTIGGPGGAGGRSGWSGNGAGGPSIGIAVHGTTAVLVNTPTPAVGSGGPGALFIAGGGKFIPTSGAGTAASIQPF